MSLSDAQDVSGGPTHCGNTGQLLLLSNSYINFTSKIWIVFFVAVTMLLGNTSFFPLFFPLGKPIYMPFKMKPNLDRNVYLWDVQQSRVCGLRPR